jgi:hypothetical protein
VKIKLAYNKIDFFAIVANSTKYKRTNEQTDKRTNEQNIKEQTDKRNKK